MLARWESSLRERLGAPRDHRVTARAVDSSGRRWGPAVGGWLAGLPLTSGPVSLILALEQGPEFTARAALGTLFGLISLAAFSFTGGIPG